jgi:hypothetical protein
MRLSICSLSIIFISNLSCYTRVDIATARGEKSNVLDNKKYDCKPDSLILLEYSKNLNSLEKFANTDTILFTEREKSFDLIIKIKELQKNNDCLIRQESKLGSILSKCKEQKITAENLLKIVPNDEDLKQRILFNEKIINALNAK